MSTPPPISPAFVDMMTPPPSAEQGPGPFVTIIREDTQADVQITVASLAEMLGHVYRTSPNERLAALALDVGVVLGLADRP